MSHEHLPRGERAVPADGEAADLARQLQLAIVENAELRSELGRYVRAFDRMYNHSQLVSEIVVKCFGSTTHSPLARSCSK